MSAAILLYPARLMETWAHVQTKLADALGAERVPDRAAAAAHRPSGGAAPRVRLRQPRAAGKLARPVPRRAYRPDGGTWAEPEATPPDQVSGFRPWTSAAVTTQRRHLPAPTLTVTALQPPGGWASPERSTRPRLALADPPAIG